MVRVMALSLLVLAACGETTADVAGDYTVNVTNGANGCMVEGWMEGDTASNISLVITQDGSSITGTVGGLTGAWLELVLGSRVFTGSVEGSDIAMTLYGTRSAMDGNCTYTVNATAIGEVDGDFLDGTILYEAATNGNPDCSELEDCQTVQSFNGSRPPE